MQVKGTSTRVIFPPGLDSQAQRINNISTLLNNTTLHTIGNKIRKWNVVLLNHNTEANAFVRLAPVVSELYMVPAQDNFSLGSLRWDDNLIIHENRHMQQFSNFNHGFTRAFSFLFGQEGQLLANGLTIPDYFFEGDAIFQETLVSRQGRGRIPSFFNGMKALWLAKKDYNWMQLRNGSLRKFIPDHYELGYPVVLYGYKNYGEDFWRKVTTDAVNFKGLFYSYNRAVKKYSGKSYQQFTKDALLQYKKELIPQESNQNLNFISPAEKNNVVDYLYPQFVSDDTIIVTKQSYRLLNSFYLLSNGNMKQLRVKDYVIDDYFSYNAGKVVYATYKSQALRANKTYSVLKVLDIYSNTQVQLTNHTLYFSPDINSDGTEIIAVNVTTDGRSTLHRLSAKTGSLIQQLPNPDNYFFTHTKYIDKGSAVSAVRNPAGEMALVKTNFTDGAIEQLTPFSYAVLGFPCVKHNNIYFTMADDSGAAVDRIFMLSLATKKIYRLTYNLNGVYQPCVNNKGEMVFTAVTADGSRLAKLSQPVPDTRFMQPLLPTFGSNLPGLAALNGKGTGIIDQVQDTRATVTKYSKWNGLFNFHSARPFADDPEFGYTFYSDNSLSDFHSEVTYTYNRNEESHSVGYNLVYSGLFPFFRAGVERSFSREVDIGTTQVRTFQYNANKLNAGFNIPLRLINGRTFKYLNIGGGYNAEYIPYELAGKNVRTKALNYLNAYIVFSNQSRMAKQFINPQWAQMLTITYRDAFTVIDNHKLVADGSFYFPGLMRTHSFVIDGAYQRRDTLGDFFSKTFSFARGYQELNQRQMYKIGFNYHLPLLYPDWGFGNIIFFQRIRMNAFYDYGSSLTKFTNGSLREIKTRSTGAELFFDTKVWNALPVNFGVRYSRLLDNDLLNPGAVNRWEIILPLNIIPD